MTAHVNYKVGTTYEVVDQNGDTRKGIYTGREQGAGVTFDVFQTHDSIEFQPGFVVVFLPVKEALPMRTFV